LDARLSVLYSQPTSSTINQLIFVNCGQVKAPPKGHQVARIFALDYEGFVGLLGKRKTCADA
jgi:hypothetical protein